MTKIDIDRLSEQELIDLNHKIVSRLRFLREMRSHAEMMNFRIGEKVRFQPSGHSEVTGTLTRYNKKSVTVIAEDGMRWTCIRHFYQRQCRALRRPMRRAGMRLSFCSGSRE